LGVSDARVTVLLPLPFDHPFDYTRPDGLLLQAGDLVSVPLGGRMVVGAVWDDAPGDAPSARLRAVAAKLEAPALPDTLRRFVDWVAQYTMAPRGAVLALALKANLLGPIAQAQGWQRGAALEAWALEVGALEVGAQGAQERPAMTAARARVLDILGDGAVWETGRLAKAARVSASVVRAMAQAGLLVPGLRTAQAPQPDPDYPGPVLSAAQDAQAARLRAAVLAQEFSVTLLEGVTGSGKTEVYLEAVAAALRRGQQALVLLPEIALSAQFTARLTARFGVAPAVWHSALSPGKRRATWQAIAAGRISLVLGARSALFLPFDDLGVVIVDEEHEAAYKQEEGVIYHARDMAVVRARLAGCAAILASATPALESWVNATQGRYRHAMLAARHGGAAAPSMTTVDLRVAPPERGRFLSPVMIEAISATLASGAQAMLFLNRRGYAPLMLCRRCGHRISCPHCTAWLVAHRAQDRLLCHHCGHTVRMPTACPSCGAAESLVPIGPGVERIAEEVQALLPRARPLLMTSDVIGSAEQAQAAVGAIEAGAVDLVIGTQMMAKGWHFPNLTLVGVVDADLGLAGGDLRAAERSAQLLHQVAGRVGRAEQPGRALLQTYQPEHPVMRALASGDLAGFRAAEAALRRPGHWPPFGRLAAVIVTADEAEAVAEACHALAMHAPVRDGLVVLGPAPAPFAMLRGRHRWRFLLKAERAVPVQAVLRDWLARVRLPRSVRIIVDIDPISFL
jgi:primosomal protein N' (replication factor Y)